eukprot:m.183974 g.183974  ORF g.183974 m.183974 type:complete len:113 (-) comp16661_c6_seq1:352-690(-)
MLFSAFIFAFVAIPCLSISILGLTVPAADPLLLHALGLYGLVLLPFIMHDDVVLDGAHPCCSAPRQPLLLSTITAPALLPACASTRLSRAALTPCSVIGEGTDGRMDGWTNG